MKESQAGGDICRKPGEREMILLPRWAGIRSGKHVENCEVIAAGQYQMHPVAMTVASLLNANCHFLIAGFFVLFTNLSPKLCCFPV
jgi:hypothetical protein